MTSRWKSGTHRLAIQDFLHEGDAVRRGLPTTGARPGKDVAVLKREWYRLCLYERGPGEAHVCEGAEDAGMENVAEGGE